MHTPKHIHFVYAVSGQLLKFIHEWMNDKKTYWICIYIILNQ